MSQLKEITKYRGRFAPTPSGMLHFGSLVTAVGSYLDARSHQGEWFVRIEDIDRPRVKVGMSENILSTLELFGLEWDGPVIYQSQCIGRYQEALHFLEALGLIYPCNCTRKEIADSALFEFEGMVYPGNCRNGLHSERNNRPSAVRIKTDTDKVEFHDRLQEEFINQLKMKLAILFYEDLMEFILISWRLWLMMVGKASLTSYEALICWSQPLVKFFYRSS